MCQGLVDHSWPLMIGLILLFWISLTAVYQNSEMQFDFRAKAYGYGVLEISVVIY